MMAHGRIRSLGIVGCGLIGASLALALRQAGFDGEIVGFDRAEAECAAAERLGVFSSVRLVGASAASAAAEARAVAANDAVVLATPVLAVLEWMERLAPLMREGSLITDVGSTKGRIAARAAELAAGRRGLEILPGHPMAGKESGGAALAEASLFRDATWLLTPIAPASPTAPAPPIAPAPLIAPASPIAAAPLPVFAALHPPAGFGTSAAPSAPVAQGSLAAEWLHWLERIGARVRLMHPAAHDEVCAWVSHLPQMLSTALAALVQDTFAPHTLAQPAADGASQAHHLTLDDIHAIAGRALGETTRLGASPFSMWRDIALTNTDPIAASLLALEQRLAHLRENLRTPELREEFRTANRFRASGPPASAPPAATPETPLASGSPASNPLASGSPAAPPRPTWG